MSGVWGERRFCVGAAVLAFFVLAASAQAAFPGRNGQIVFSTGPTPDLFAIDFDGRNARAVAVRPARDENPNWSPDGKKVGWVSYGTGRAQMMVADADGTNVRRLAPSSGYDYGPSWSPDGRSILFTSGRDGTGTTEVYAAAADGTDVRRLTFRPLEDVHPVWSPDGTRIAWSSRETNRSKFDVYVMDADGSNQRTLIERPAVQDSSPAWSPDGQRIIWSSYNRGGEIWIANADGSGIRRLYSTPYLLYSPVWSPDGRFIAFTQRRGSGDSRPFDVWVIRADGSGASLVIGIDRRPSAVSVDWQPFADRGAQPASLLRDGGAEDGFGGHFVGVPYLVPGWETNGGLTALRYGLPGFPAEATPPPVVAAGRGPVGGVRPGEGGVRFLFGGVAAVSTAVQDVDLAERAAEIDTGRASVTLSGLLGGRGAEADEGTVVGTFLDGAGQPLGLVQLGPVTPADRGNATRFVGRLQTATLPAGTRTVRVTLTATRRAGTTNDAYFDNLALTYTKPADPPPMEPPPPVTPPPPTPPGRDEGAGGAGPAAGGGAPAAGRVSRLRIAPRRFAVANRRTATIARGARISYRLSRAGLVTLKISRVRPGRRSARGRCVAPTRANRGRRRCSRVTPVTTMLRRSRTGANSIAFSGRVGRRTLVPGTYRLTASAANRASVTFRIVRR